MFKRLSFCLNIYESDAENSSQFFERHPLSWSFIDALRELDFMYLHPYWALASFAMNPAA